LPDKLRGTSRLFPLKDTSKEWVTITIPKGVKLGHIKSPESPIILQLCLCRFTNLVLCSSRVDLNCCAVASNDGEILGSQVTQISTSSGSQLFPEIKLLFLHPSSNYQQATSNVYAGRKFKVHPSDGIQGSTRGSSFRGPDKDLRKFVFQYLERTFFFQS
jgi:hypothetical protein